MSGHNNGQPARPCAAAAASGARLYLCQTHGAANPCAMHPDWYELGGRRLACEKATKRDAGHHLP